MIENIELYNDDKITLKHLSIDKHTPLNEWMVKKAKEVLEQNPDINVTPIGDYTTYTMDIPRELKVEIREFVKLNDIKIRDFWIHVAKDIIDEQGD